MEKSVLFFLSPRHNLYFFKSAGFIYKDVKNTSDFIHGMNLHSYVK